VVRGVRLRPLGVSLGRVVLAAYVERWLDMKETPLASIPLHGGHLLQFHQRGHDLAIELWSKTHENGRQWQLTSSQVLGLIAQKIATGG
jgi:hypothetical protein